jgi:ubiquitin-activating enzyme E1 C
MYSSGDPLFMWGPPQIHEQTKPNLEKLVSDLVPEGDEILVTDPNLPFNLTIKVTYA